jgi:hypothetical protein
VRLLDKIMRKKEEMPQVESATAAEEEEEEAAAPPAVSTESTASNDKEEKDKDKAKDGESKKEEEDKVEEAKAEEEKADDSKPESEKESGAAASGEEKKEDAAAAEEDDANAIWEPAPPDVLSGRGASVNAHPGNKKFRALCFVRKPEFEAGNHAAKRRVATEIVTTTFDGDTARFLKKKRDKGPWFAMTKEQAILKACQVMRDYKRPDRMAMREMMQQNGQARKRSRSQEPSTPLLEAVSFSCIDSSTLYRKFFTHNLILLCLIYYYYSPCQKDPWSPLLRIHLVFMITMSCRDVVPLSMAMWVTLVFEL